MLLRLLLLFTIVPLVDLCLLLQAARWIGPAATVAIVLLTGTLGAAVVFHQGRRSFRRIFEQLQRGTLPAAAMGDALMLALAAVLLITPGLVTDLVGLLLLMPAVRRAVLAIIESRGRRWLDARTQVVIERMHEPEAAPHGEGDATGARREVIDVGFRRRERAG